MRFLFTVQPLFGHFHAMVPLAQALKEHGHEVAFATGPKPASRSTAIASCILDITEMGKWK